MTFLKSITLFLVAAIANPMCCCLALADMGAEALPKHSADAHACCHVEDTPSTDSTATPAGEHDCFHEEIESYQISDNTGSATSLSVVPILHVLDYVDATSVLCPLETASLTEIAKRDDSLLHQSGISYSQKYCVFIL